MEWLAYEIQKSSPQKMIDRAWTHIDYTDDINLTKLDRCEGLENVINLYMEDKIRHRQNIIQKTIQNA